MSPWSRQVGVAGIQFDLRSRDASVSNAMPESYASFISPAPESCDLRCGVEIRLGDLPDLSSRRRIFDAGRSWAMYDDGGQGRLIQRKAAAGATPDSSWIAFASADFSDVDVRCSEGMVQDGDAGPELINPLRYPLDQILTNHLLSSRGGVLVHGAGVAFNGHGLLFAGRSGAGKTTISRQLHGNHGMRILSDDRIVVRGTPEGIHMYGTPWPGDGRHALNENRPLQALLFLAHATENEIVELSSSEALERLLPVASIPWYDGTAADGSLRFCDRLIREVSCHELRCRADTSVADFIAEQFQ